MADDMTEMRHPDMDYDQHEQTWHNVMNLTKWGVISIAVLLVILYFVVQP